MLKTYNNYKKKKLYLVTYYLKRAAHEFLILDIKLNIFVLTLAQKVGSKIIKITI